MKNKKHTKDFEVRLPNYIVSEQEKQIKDFIAPSGLPFERMQSFIYADFLYAVAKGVSKGMDSYEIFQSYLVSVQKTCDDMMRMIMESAKNDQK